MQPMHLTCPVLVPLQSRTSQLSRLVHVDGCKIKKSFEPLSVAVVLQYMLDQTKNTAPDSRAPYDQGSFGAAPAALWGSSRTSPSAASAGERGAGIVVAMFRSAT